MIQAVARARLSECVCVCLNDCDAVTLVVQQWQLIAVGLATRTHNVSCVLFDLQFEFALLLSCSLARSFVSTRIVLALSLASRPKRRRLRALASLASTIGAAAAAVCLTLTG